MCTPDFFKNASEDDWDDIMKAAVTRKSDMKKLRERVYLRILYDLSEEDIDDIQGYFIHHFPQFIKDTILTKNNYHVLTALGCDLGMSFWYLLNLQYRFLRDAIIFQICTMAIS